MILHFARPYKLSFLSLLISCIAGAMLSMFYPYIFGILVNEVFYHHDLSFLKVIVVSYGIIFLCEQGINFLMYLIWSYLMTRFLFDIRKSIFEKVLFLEAKILTRISSGDLLVLTNKDIIEVMNFININVFHVLARTIRFLTAVFFVAYINWKLAILMFVVVPISVWVSIFLAQRAKPNLERYREKYGLLVGWIFDILSGLRDVQLMTGERNVTLYFVKELNRMLRLRISTSFIEVTLERLNTLLSLFSDLMLYFYAAYLIYHDELAIGGFVAILEYFSISKIVLKYITEAPLRIENNLVSIHRIVELLESPSEVSSSFQKQRQGSIRIMTGKIEIKDIYFSFEEQNQLLRGVNLTIASGEKLALVGKSGAGKSTMVGLLLGFYQPQQGAIFIDEVKIDNCNHQSLREAIGVVQQECLLFDETIEYNLRLGKPRATMQEIWQACEAAYIAEFIRSLPLGLKTIVGNGGVRLSGGQRQRIALARIFLKNPPILIMDEATSALDTEAEKEVQKAWQKLSDGRTCLIIAHRLSTVLAVDKIAFLHQGKIHAVGKHHELFEKVEDYQRLFAET